ncbi:MAG: ATPase [Proteobacteria bacterium]|nr:ATPase [Pseudomonadota bacterium]
MKRFYGEVLVTSSNGGFAVALDGKPVRTPAKAALNLPNVALAEAVADEWRAQEQDISPEDMPLTRLANSAIDRVAPARDLVIDGTTAYGVSDLLYYRAEEPAELAAAQAAGWDPYLDWLKTAHGLEPAVTRGILPVEQSDALKAALRQAVAAYDDFALAGLNVTTALSGSLIVALAVAEGFAGAEDAWEASQVDESWQATHWGIDDEARERSAANRAQFLDAAKFVALARDPA